ncbi:cysteine-rich venom protein-like isoform X2 [Rana temporaria]|uniref:cysteine-rich venom protein-like isoform X2 n=1 Tax=Rana temporaria TaxID=8407 RepID=UPI001AADBB5A|nr:cysteine-rich venom protein-like isoform X2 [Rana temporaria]
MKTFLKILLAANFLLQISMANEKSKLDEDKGGDTEQYQSTPGPNQDYEKSKLDEDKGGEKDEGSNGTEQHQSTPGPNQDDKTSESQVDKGSNEDHETEERDNVIYPDDIVPCDILSTRKKKVQDEIVKIHNEYRSNVTPSAGNMLRMKWSNKLMESAERWAVKCYLNHSEVKDRNDDGVPFGENILSSPACVKWDMAIKQWYNEKVYLIWGVGPVGTNVTGHYTQMVTDSTFEAGCALKLCILNKIKRAFYVCQYYPPELLLTCRHGFELSSS